MTGPAKRWVQLEGMTWRFHAGTDRLAVLDSTEYTTAQTRAFFGADSLRTGTLNMTRGSAWASIPFGLSITVKYRLPTGELRESNTAAATCGPTIGDAPVARPQLTLQLNPPEPLQPGDTLKVSYNATSTIGIWQTRLAVSGAFAETRTINETLGQGVERTVSIVIPHSSLLGSRVFIAVTTMDALGQSTMSQVTTPPLVDQRPPFFPTSQAELTSAFGRYAVGDVLRLSVVVTDNHALGWLYYQVEDPIALRDSVRILSGANRLVADSFPLDSRWLGSPRISFMATDTMGNRSAWFALPADSIDVMPPEVARPFHTFPLSGDYGEILIDSARQRVYITRANVSQITVLSLQTMSMQPPIALPGPPGGMDLSLSGDTLLVSIEQRKTIALIDPNTGTVLSELVLSLPPNSSDLRPRKLRTMANGRTLVMLFTNVTASGQHILELDPATGSQRVRPEIVNTSDYPWRVDFERSRDRRAAVWFSAQCAYLYRVEEDRFGECRPMTTDGRLAAGAGTRYLKGTFLHDGALNAVGPLWRTSGSNATALSHDDAFAFTSINGKLQQIRLSDGKGVARFSMPNSALLRLTPDGRYAIGVAVGFERIYVMDISRP